MDRLITEFTQPEHLHAILNHWPVLGVASGLVILLVAAFQRSLPTARAACVLMALAAVFIYPVMELGEKSEDQVDGLIDEDGRAWLHEHEERAEKAAILFYLTAGLAAAGALVPGRHVRVVRAVLVLTFLAGVTAFVAGSWTGSAGGKIIHKEFRYSPPPQRGGDE